jgi:hypothetical protein
VVEKSPTKTKPVIAKNALAASFLALKVLMQVGEMLQNKNKFSAQPLARLVSEIKK